MEDIIDLKKLLVSLKHNKWWLVGAIIFSVGMMSIYLWLIATPIYQSHTQILISQTETKDIALQSQNVQANLDLIDTYNVIIKSPRILGEVSKELKNQYSEDELTQAIQVSNASNSQIIDIKVESSNPNAAAKIANTTATTFQKEIMSIMKVDNVTILSEARVEANPKPIKPQKPMMIVVSLFIGVFVGVAIVFTRNLVDRTIKNDQDVQLLGVTFLGTISEIIEEEP